VTIFPLSNPSDTELRQQKAAEGEGAEEPKKAATTKKAPAAKKEGKAAPKKRAPKKVSFVHLPPSKYYLTGSCIGCR
jgi:hypothetical protein